jgi:hypothetical protein
MLFILRLFLVLGALVAAGAACANDPSECPEPCLAGQRCYYGACVPLADAGEADGSGD